MSKDGLLKTGIKGLDDILLGGIPRTNVVLLQGVTGSGKTLMGLEFIYNGIVQYNEPGIIVVFETSPNKLVRDAAGFGWNLDELQDQKKLQIVFTTPQLMRLFFSSRFDPWGFRRFASSSRPTRASDRLIICCRRR